MNMYLTASYLAKQYPSVTDTFPLKENFKMPYQQEFGKEWIPMHLEIL
jgi:hypothetical protein